MAIAEYHIEPNYRRIAEEAATGERRYPDEMLFEFVSALDPPFLPADCMDALRSFLCPEAARGHGRRKKSEIDRSQLVEALGAIATNETAVDFAAALIRRLKSAKRYSLYDYNLRLSDWLWKCDRNNLIRGIYRELTSILRTGAPYYHPILGTLPFDKAMSNYPPMIRALLATKKVMASLGHPHDLRIDTMRNLVGQSFEYRREHDRRFKV